jgi:hypothetical protein
MAAFITAAVRTSHSPVLFKDATPLSEDKLRVFENRMLRRIFGRKRDGVMGGWKKLHNEELHDLYSSPGIIRIIKSRRMRWVGHVARMGEKRNVYRLLVGKPGGKRPLGRRDVGGWITLRWAF